MCAYALVIASGLVAHGCTVGSDDEAKSRTAQTPTSTVDATSQAVDVEWPAENRKMPSAEKEAVRATIAAWCDRDTSRGCEAASPPAGMYFGRKDRSWWTIARLTESEVTHTLTLRRSREGSWRVEKATDDEVACGVPQEMAVQWALVPAPARSSGCVIERSKARGMQRRTSDLTELRATIERLLPDISRFWRDHLQESLEATYVAPEIVGSYEAGDATPTCGDDPPLPGNAFYCRSNNASRPGFIAWDEKGLMLPVFRREREPAVGLILAHEWGHAMQELVGWLEAPKVALEASADCLAGVWAKRAVEDGVLDRHALNDMASELFELADSEEYTWLDASHGQPVDRIAAFTDGTRYAAEHCTPDRFVAP